MNVSYEWLRAFVPFSQTPPELRELITAHVATVDELVALREERYGYTLRQSLEQAGLPIDEGALYPLLRRLETQGLLTSEWREEAKRNKRFYRLSDDGGRVLAQLLGEWNAISESILRLETQGEK